MKIGFIGQGWVGKNLADDFDRRGYKTVRYGLEQQYVPNKNKIKGCKITFIAVPTPTTSNGFEVSVVKKALGLIGKGNVAVIKSTLLPGTTEKLQEENPSIFVFHSPEFLTEMTVVFDTANPLRNIIGIPRNNAEYQKKAKEILNVLPKAPYELICDSKEAELIKYAGNCYLYTKVVFMNIIFNISEKLDCDWETIRSAMVADSRIGKSHTDPVHQGGRGAGGHCFIKDFAALIECYSNLVDDKSGLEALKAYERKNIELLIKSNKDINIVDDIYRRKKSKLK